jgi:putative transcriptional regulator
MITLMGGHMETKIRQFRQELGMTQQELADSVGVTRQTINALENARYNPSLLLAYKISKILGKDSIEDVFVLNEND